MSDGVIATVLAPIDKQLPFLLHEISLLQSAIAMKAIRWCYIVAHFSHLMPVLHSMFPRRKPTNLTTRREARAALAHASG
jgi:hypothetical protein